MTKSKTNRNIKAGPKHKFWALNRMAKKDSSRGYSIIMQFLSSAVPSLLKKRTEL